MIQKFYYISTKLAVPLVGCVLFAAWNQMATASDDFLETANFDQLIETVDREIYHDPEYALKCAETALEVAEKNESVFETATALNRIGAAHTSLGDLNSGLQYFERSLDLAGKHQFDVLIARNTGNIGVVYYHSGDSIGAIKNYKRALEIYQKQNEQPRVFAMLNNIAKAYMDNGQLVEARKYFETAGAMTPENFGLVMPVFLLNYARLHYREGKLDQCLKMLDESETIATEYQDIRALCKIIQVRARVHLDRGAITEALALGEVAYEMAGNSKLMDLIDETTSLLAEIYHANGDSDRAYEFQTRSRELRAKLQTGVIRNQLDLLRAKEDQLELVSLKQKNELLNTRNKYRGILILLLGGVILISAVFVVLLVKKNDMIHRQNERLHESSEFKTKLLGVVAHDIRAPISSLVSLMSLIDPKANDQTDQEELLNALREQSESTLELVDDLLEWVMTGTHGTLTENGDIVAFSDLLGRIKKDVQNLTRSKDIEIVDQTGPSLEVESGQSTLSVVLRNTLINAIKFSHRNSQIHVYAGEDEAFYQVKVVDNGVGMSSEQLKQLFTSKTNSVVGTEGETGHGIGLLLCHELLDRIGGDITAESTLGKGTTFLFRLPKKQT